MIIMKSEKCRLTNRISLKPLHSSDTTFLICGTRLKIRRGLKHLKIRRSWIPDCAGTSFGIQHENTKETWKILE